MVPVRDEMTTTLSVLYQLRPLPAVSAAALQCQNLLCLLALSFQV